MYLDSKKKIEELGIRLIDPDTYDFKIADHVCVYIYQKRHLKNLRIYL